MKEAYDVVIIGSGLGGLVSANILAKEGYSVCVEIPLKGEST